jgi:hypothetical protein
MGASGHCPDSTSDDTFGARPDKHMSAGKTLKHCWIITIYLREISYVMLTIVQTDRPFIPSRTRCIADLLLKRALDH